MFIHFISHLCVFHIGRHHLSILFCFKVLSPFHIWLWREYKQFLGITQIFQDIYRKIRENIWEKAMKSHNNNEKCAAQQKQAPTISLRMALSFALTIFYVTHSFPFPGGLGRGKPAYLNIPEWRICTDEAKPSPGGQKHLKMIIFVELTSW